MENKYNPYHHDNVEIQFRFVSQKGFMSGPKFPLHLHVQPQGCSAHVGEIKTDFPGLKTKVLILDENEVFTLGAFALYLPK